jgi:hypothetical protein
LSTGGVQKQALDTLCSWKNAVAPAAVPLSPNSYGEYIDMVKYFLTVTTIERDWQNFYFPSLFH